MATGKRNSIPVALRLRSANPDIVDRLVAAAVAVPTAMPFLSPESGSHAPTLIGAILTTGTVLPLIWRRHAPLTVGMIVALFAFLTSAYDRPGQQLQYGALVAIFTVADMATRPGRLAYFWALAIAIPLGPLLIKDSSLPDFMFTVLLPLSAYLLGIIARANRERTKALQAQALQLERGREAEAARAAAEERNRIARDMHDVLAHAVSIMVVQAEAGPVILRTDPDKAARAFETIAEAGRDAMSQLRRTLGLLKADQDTGVRTPAPTLDGVATLVERARQVIPDVQLVSRGTPRALQRDAELAAYRIVQEALTNIMKHSHADAAVVQLEWDETYLVVTITDNGLGETLTQPAERSGHGLIGIAQRATACGGSADAGPLPGGGFQVQAFLPHEPMNGIEAGT